MKPNPYNSPPIIADDAYMPELEALSRAIIGHADRGELTLGYLERAIALYTVRIRQP